MKRTVVLLLVILSMSAHIFGQLPDGAAAPDLFGVDIDGQAHDLHDIIGSGRGVLLDFSATWCGPCWAFHQTHAAEQLYQNYGPQGSDEIRVLWLEGDQSTDLDDIMGTGSLTLGDWTSCTSYPLIDDMQAFLSAYQVGGFPVVMGVSEIDTTVQDLGMPSFFELRQFFIDEGSIVLDPVDASLGLSCEVGTTVVCGAEGVYSPVIEVYNLGSEVMTEALFEVYLDGDLISTDSWSGAMMPSSSETISLSDLSVDQSGEVEVRIILDDDANVSNNSIVQEILYSEASTETSVTVEITTDNFGAETYWHIEDGSGQIVISGGNPWVGTTNIGVGFGNGAPDSSQGAYGNNEFHTETVDLDQAACYNFVITDYWGGGMSNGNGSYRVLDDQGEVIIPYQPFDAIEVLPFENVLPNALPEYSPLYSMAVYPNPAYDQLGLSMDLLSAKQVTTEIYSLVGDRLHQEVHLLASGKGVIEVNVSKLAAGVYVLHVLVDGERAMKRIIVEE